MKKFILLFHLVIGSDQTTPENEVDTKRREALGITTEVVKHPKWTPNGTVYTEEVKDIFRGNSKKPHGCTEQTLFGLYDWDCMKGVRKLGYWSNKSKCRVYCLSSQVMDPKAKLIKCKCDKRTGTCAWITKIKGQGLVSNPDFKCITNVSRVYWSPWSAWSDWTKCSTVCGDGQRIRQKRRRCVNGVMGEHVNCQHQGHVMLDYDSCKVECDAPPEVRASVDEVIDKAFKIHWTIHNINQREINHFLVEVWEEVIEWSQQRYQIAKFDMINAKLRDIHVWREVRPNTAYDVWVWMKDSRGKELAKPTLVKVTTEGSRFDYSENEECVVDFPTTMKDAMVTSCDHMTVVPGGHRCYTYCKDDWRKMRGSEYMVCMGNKWRGSWPTCEPRGWRCGFNYETYCPGCVRPPNCCEHIVNEGNVQYVCKGGYLKPESRAHNDRGLARVLMSPLESSKASCMTVRPRRNDCTLNYQVKIIALYTTTDGSRPPRERVLVDVANNAEWKAKCRNNEDYEVEVMDVKPDSGYDTVQIVFEQHVDRHDASLGYDMWFDDFHHGYGRCATMRCGEFPPPLLKGGGAEYGHDVAETNTCTNGDKAGSQCEMNCPDTHPVHHFAHYWQEIICLPSGFWNQPLYTYYTGYCQAPACNFFDILPPDNGWYSCSYEGYEGSVCTFGCNSVDFMLDNKAPYRIQCQNSMWVPVGGSKAFTTGKIHPKCVFNHVFARREEKIMKPLPPLVAMKRQYRELAGLDYPSELRRDNTEHNIEMTRRRFGNDERGMINFEQVYNSAMQETDFETDSEMFSSMFDDSAV